MSHKSFKIESHGETLDAWLFEPISYPSSKKAPAIVLAHGLGCTKDMRLDAYSQRFAAHGFLCVAFDYRHFGDSTGLPRGLIDPNRQLQDWDTVIRHVATMPNVDPNRIGIFGSSFSGGHVIRVAAEHPDLVKAAVSQVPFTSGLASVLAVGLLSSIRLSVSAVSDYLFGTTDPVRVKLCGKPGDVALMPTDDAVPGMLSMLPPGVDHLHHENVPARLALTLPLLRPGSYAANVKQPIFFVIAGNDSVAPAPDALACAKRAPRGEIKYLNNVGHFDPYTGDLFNTLTRDYINFFTTAL